MAECRVDIPAGDVGAALRAAPEFASTAADLGSNTMAWIGALRSLGRHDLTTARVIEPHLDALAILREAGLAPQELGAAPDAVWGVYASRAPGLRATQDAGGAWRLDGTKPWCSLGDVLSWALVSAGTDEGQRLFAVRLDESVESVDEPWVSRGLAAIRSTGLTFHGTSAQPVGAAGFYLSRDGFAWGGIGVAAVWAGGFDALLASLVRAAQRREPDQIALMHLGRLDATARVIDVVLADAARAIDAGEANGSDGGLLAARARAIVAAACEQALEVVGHALGPGPLAADETHARRVADLTIYVRQHHAERDLAALGRSVLDVEDEPISDSPASSPAPQVQR